MRSPHARRGPARRVELFVEPAPGVALPGDLAVPERATGVVVFAHGSGSSRLSRRNQMVARHLNRQGTATFLFDLLTEAEAGDRANVFDVALLAERLESATGTVARSADVPDLPVAFFGASTGAAAALWAAAEPHLEIAAVVSRGGRPDLAADRLGAVRAPTLLIVGSEDRTVLGLNEEAARQLGCERRLDVVPGATHLFEEPGALEHVAELAAAWFAEHFAQAHRPGVPD